MNNNQISGLLDTLQHKQPQADIQLIETHISWIVLVEKLAYKIKKPLKFSFLDFSTLTLRHHFCRRELKLNRRLAPQMYLSVIPIRAHNNNITLEGSEGTTIDYAVKMKRLDGSRQMNKLLEENAVTPKDMVLLAETLANFHLSADTLLSPVDIHAMYEDFADIFSAGNFSSVEPFVIKELGAHMRDQIERTIDLSKQFLSDHKWRLIERNQMGFVKDGHGDLHSGNIFLLDRPVIFDCIEFNDHFRCVDIIDELAFFCMDLDLYGQQDLAHRFFSSYEIIYPCLLHPVDQNIFIYYKMYRANVKVKINCLKALQSDDVNEKQRRTQLAHRYANLLIEYAERLSH